MSLAQAIPRMNFDEFVVWAEAQPEGRYELVDGRSSSCRARVDVTILWNWLS
jgi:hypothetical protein